MNDRRSTVRRGLAVVALALLALACNKSTPDDCPDGADGCSCTEGGTCDPGLVCAPASEICYPGGSGVVGMSGSGGQGATGAIAGEGGGVSKAGSGGQSAGGSGGQSAGGSGGSGEEPFEDCMTPACSGDDCVFIVLWCDFAMRNDYFPNRYAKCSDCVAAYAESARTSPQLYCRFVFQCWNQCAIANEGDNDAVSDCIGQQCDASTPQGDGLCQG
jgi:hypothetical protein